MAAGRPRKIKTAAEFKESAVKYFKKCDSHMETRYTEDGEPYEVNDPLPYTVEGLCNAIGVSRFVLSSWEKQKNAFGEAVVMVKQRITENRVVGGLRGRQNAGLVKFLLTNNDAANYRDKQEIEHTGHVQLEGLLAELDGTANKIG